MGGAKIAENFQKTHLIFFFLQRNPNLIYGNKIFRT